MKMNVEVECTPEEARRFLGLPDLTPIHDAYVAKLTEAMSNGGITPDMAEALVRSWTPMGESAMKLWTQLFEQRGGRGAS